LESGWQDYCHRSNHKKGKAALKHKAAEEFSDCRVTLRQAAKRRPKGRLQALRSVWIETYSAAGSAAAAAAASAAAFASAASAAAFSAASA
jgi:hypothetical protein